VRPFMRRCIEEASRIGRVLAHSAERYFADSCPQHAAGIAYRVLFSIVPLAIVLVSIFGVILGNQTVHDAVVDTIVGALPSTAAVAVGLTPQVITDELADLGRRVGPPWQRDQKDATLAAWSVLRFVADR